MKKKPAKKTAKAQPVDETLDHLDFKKEKPVKLTKAALKKAFKLGAIVYLQKVEADHFSMVPLGYDCTGVLSLTDYGGLLVKSPYTMNDCSEPAR